MCSDTKKNFFFLRQAASLKHPIKSTLYCSWLVLLFEKESDKFSVKGQYAFNTKKTRILLARPIKN